MLRKEQGAGRRTCECEWVNESNVVCGAQGFPKPLGTGPVRPVPVLEPVGFPPKPCLTFSNPIERVVFFWFVGTGVPPVRGTLVVPRARATVVSATRL
jgi:hypothetical protein